jgi:hypothetical protein
MDSDTIIISVWSKNKTVSYCREKRPSGDLSIPVIRQFLETSKNCSCDGIILDGSDIILYENKTIVKFICQGDIVTRILIDQKHGASCEIMYQNDSGEYLIHLKDGVKTITMNNHSISTSDERMDPFTIRHSQLQNKYTFEQITELPIDCEAIYRINEMLGYGTYIPSDYGSFQERYRKLIEMIQNGEPASGEASCDDFSDMESE